jgi:hypothetical protein
MARKLGSWVLALALGALVLGIGLAGARTTASTSLLVQVLGRGTVTASGGQINCGNGANQCYFQAGNTATITLTATPMSGWTFDGWDSRSDDCSGSTNPCTFTLNVGDEDENIAVFTTSPAPGTSTLTVTVTGDSSNQGGTVEADNDQINCDPGETDCTLDVTTGSTITLVQTPQSGYDFAGWGGPCSGTGRSCTVDMSSDQTLNASFVTGASSHTLTVSVTGNGTVTGSGISCTSAGGSGCTATVDANASVTLSATAGSGAGFTVWGGGCSGTTPTCTFTMTSDTAVTAAFTDTGGGGGGGTTFPLTVSVTGTGRVTGGGIDCGDGNSTCSISLASGTTVTLTAAASSDADFKGWGGACSGTNTKCTVTMTAARSVTATFAKPTSPTAVALMLHVVGKGTVSASGGTCASSGKTTMCNQSYDAGTEVTLTATPQAGATFTGWSGACSGTELTCTITLDQAATVTATFSGARVPAHAGAALRSRGRPIVHHTRSGFRVTLRFTTTQRGVARVRALRAGRVQTALTFTIASGPATIGPFPVTKPGFYRFELTVGTRALHWTACLGRCGAAAHAAPFVLTRGPAKVLDAGALWSVSVRFHATLPSGALVRIYRSGRLVRTARFLLRAGEVSAGPFLLSPGTYRLRLTATDAYGRTRMLSWYALLS